jgi:hypothetical protein
MGGFADETTALAFPEWAQYHDKDTGWDLSCCIVQPLLWDPAFDRTDPVTHEIKHQPYDFIWRVIVSLPEASQELLDSSPTQLVFDTETGEVILTRYFTEATFQRLWMQPTYVGAKYPFKTGQGGLIP